jgi:hypothetical protein
MTDPQQNPVASGETPYVAPESACPIPESPARKSRIPKSVYSIYVFFLAIWKFSVGVVFTQSVLLSFLVVGWTFRAAQRAVQKQWWKMSRITHEACFCEFTQLSSFHRGLGGWPNWILQNDREWMRAHKLPVGRFKHFFKAVFYSLWLNLKIGVQAVFNTLVLTLPSGSLMLFSWYAGWHNSFNKGYEQAPVGPITGLAGIVCFIAAMYYVPIAQIRQASTGNWRSFYDFKTVWQLIRKKWLSCLGLAALYALLAIPFTIVKSAPTFFPSNSALTSLSPERALAFAKAYYLYTAFLLFGCYLILRIVAAKIYASSMVACIQSGALTEEALAECEWETLNRLDLITIKPEPARHFLVRTITWCGTKVGRATVGVALFLFWFLFIGQTYVSEFLIKTEYGRGWLNQPYVQLPWFNYIPSELAGEGKPSR